MPAWRTLAIVLVLSLPACRLLRRSSAVKPETRGQALYAANCASCHGYEVEGRAPDLFHSAVVSRDRNGNLLSPIIRGGRPALGMPSFSSFTSAQVADLAAFLHRTADQIRSDAPPGAPILTGDSVQGKAYFAVNCSGCHSATGDLAGVAARLTVRDIQNRVIYPNATTVSQATVSLPDGRKIEGVVVQDDEFNISLIGRDGWYHSWPRENATVEIHNPLAGHRALLDKFTNRDIHNVVAYLATLK